MKKLEKWCLSLLLVLFVGNAFAQQVNVNTATEKEIVAIKGIGKVKAVAIIALCQSDKAKPCKQASDLLKVKGIGKKTLEKIKEFVVFE